MVDFLFVDDPAIDEASWAKAMTAAGRRRCSTTSIAAYDDGAVGRPTR